jgi:hypothetical protein
VGDHGCQLHAGHAASGARASLSIYDRLGSHDQLGSHDRYGTQDPELG